MGSSQTLGELSEESTTQHEDGGLITYIDLSGDLNILAKTATSAEKTLVVSSKTMCLASPVWRAMLDPTGHFMEASPDNKEICLADDDGDALLILLNIIHLHFLKVPEFLSYNQLLQISVLCDKYDIVTIVRPWLSKWLEDLKSCSDTPGNEGCLFIAWIFGDLSTFKHITYNLVLNTTGFNSEAPSNASGLLSKDYMPPGIVGQ